VDRVGLLVARIIAIMVVAYTASDLNRSVTKWSLFAFFLPTLSFVFIGTRKRFLLKPSLFKQYSDEELSMKYLELVERDSRAWGTKYKVEILKEAIKLNPKNHEAYFQLAKISYFSCGEQLINDYLASALELGNDKAQEVYSNKKY